MFKYFPHTEQDIKVMLDKIGVKTIEELFAEIPESLRCGCDYDVPSSMSEIELRRHFASIANKNADLVVFRGAGSYDHYTPSIIPALISREEFLTAYTPYQPEIAQGTLQYIFEFQSMITDLTGMDVSNASMYDGPTATAEAMFMAVSQTKQNKILISKTVNPNIAKVVETYAKYRDIKLEYVNQTNGVTDAADLSAKMIGASGIIVQNPNFFGIIEDYTEVSQIVHDQKGILIMSIDPSTLLTIKTPKEFGADIVTGECQSLGVPMSFGGAYVGFLATTEKLIRKMPGRICGVTNDVDGKRAFVLTLQAREQHIRREKANSNICSNQSLMALWVTIYMSTMGKSGLVEVNRQSSAGAHYLEQQLINTKRFTKVYHQPFLKEFVLKTDIDPKKMEKALLKQGILGGLHLGDIDKAYQGHILFCVTEKRSKAEIDQLVQAIEVLA
ncbi:MAG TPA: aminomethyl-transferring glycine dehydrogenase subunit GcvPA [Bacilli bacterium]|nr:aminomethyl-transferring glycine dehydrogenase subunit GcvPA [Bacilli bacterium]